MEKTSMKFAQRSSHWSQQKMGLHWNAVAFNTYAVTTLEFVAQICKVSDQVMADHAVALRRLAPGPGNWCTIADLENLRSFGFPCEFRTIDKTARAAKLRLVEKSLPDLQQLYEELTDVQVNHLQRPFGDWHYCSFVQTLRQNMLDLQAIGITRSSVRRSLARLIPSTAQSFQTSARIAIKLASLDFDSSNRIRHKFRRWKLNILPGHIAGRVTRALLIIASRCRPCVLAAVWRTMWNGWPTSARMRSMAGNGEGTCALGCRAAADRIEHYAVCPVLWHCFAAPTPIGLGLVRQLQCLEGFLCIAHEMSDSERAQMAVGVYAAARTVHTRKDAPTADPRVLLRLHAKFGRKCRDGC